MQNFFIALVQEPSVLFYLPQTADLFYGMVDKLLFHFQVCDSNSILDEDRLADYFSEQGQICV